MDKVIIIGAGFSGLSCAYELSKIGVDTLVLEKSNFVGGLATTLRYDEYQIDIGPHFLLFAKENDRMRPLLEEIGLLEDLYRPKVRAGLYCGDSLLDPHSPLFSLTSLLRSRSLSIYDKIRLLQFILYFLSLLPELDKYSTFGYKYPAYLENTTVKDWVVAHGSENVYQKLVRPLLISVYGSDEDVPASWLASRLTKAKPRFLGSSPFYGKAYYIKDSIGRIADRLRERIEHNGGEVRLNNEVKRIRIRNNRIEKVVVANNGSEEEIRTSYVLSTVPAPILYGLVPRMPEDYAALLRQVRYSTLIFAVFGVSDVVSKFYSLYVSSDEIPFQRYTEPKHLYYGSAPGEKSFVCCEIYPRGSFSNLWEMSNDTAINLCSKGLEKIFPGVKKNIEWRRVWRINPARVLPSQAKDELIQRGTRTPVHGLYIANGEIFSSIFEAAYSVLMSVAVNKGIEAAEQILSDFNRKPHV